MTEALFTPHDDCPDRIIRQFADVRTHGDLCVFTITDDRISDAILAAHARGIKLRIVSDNDKAHNSNYNYKYNNFSTKNNNKSTFDHWCSGNDHEHIARIDCDGNNDCGND